MAGAHNNPEFTTLLVALTDLEKVQAAKNVAAMTVTPGWDVVVDLLQARKAKLLDALVKHVPVREVAEYATKLAEVRAMDAVLDACQAVLTVGQRAERELSEHKGALA